MRALALLTVAALTSACNCGGGGGMPARAGDPCAAATGCASGACFSGTCTDTSCGCGGYCGPEPRVSADCEGGWACVGTASSLYTKGTCKRACSSGCPDGWACRAGWCSEEHPPFVSIDEAPTEIAAGAPATFKASASSERSTIERIEWSFGLQLEPVTGPEVTHTFSARQLARVTATATDATGRSGTTHRDVVVCLPAGAECVPFSERGYCCTGTRCAAAPDAGLGTCQ
ncbi:MAG: PKD domain-containing protein [Myxococcaceae bacterium]|nr:PKD domain-containing protein [Myxococcaceae bacterium]